MEIEDKVCILNQAKRLGVVLDTEKYWYHKNGWYWIITDKEGCKSTIKGNAFPAPDVAELCHLLPALIADKETGGWYHLLIWKMNAKAWNAGYFDDENKILMNRWADESLAKVLCDRLIWLIENGYIEPGDLKL